MGKLERYVQKNETRPPTYTTHNNTSKWIKDLNVRLETIRILEENIGSKISDIVHSNFLLDISPQARETKEKNKQMGAQKTKMFLPPKGNQQNKKTTHRMGKHIHWYIW